MKNTPTHIAIIPDGNRRWAKKHGLPAWKGHGEGAKRVEEIIKVAKEAGVKWLTVWGGSYDNLFKRSEAEVKALDKAYREAAEKIVKDKEIKKNGVRVRFIGEWSKFLTATTKTAIKKAETATKNNKNLNLTLLIGYNGDREMLSAVKKLTRSGKSANDEDIKKALWTADLPAVDLIIRTGGEPHLSAGFMMWHVRYSALHFSDKLWPEFKPADFKKALALFASRERRKGK